ncbi:MAG: lactate utilization protein [Christensenellaceae bacterium]|nr:lactate utilization protein [Christensenellaceae bacterium]
MGITEKSIKLRNKLLAERTIKNLKSRKFDAYYCENKEEALKMAISLIPKEDSISWGGSMTMEDIGLISYIKENGYNVIDRDSAKSPQERMEMMRKGLLADTFLLSANAIAEEGILVTMDGVGNRVAAICFGPKSVIVVASINKICSNIDSAIDRLKNVASPMNVQRIASGMDAPFGTPCSVTGLCGDCKADNCICSHLVQTRMCKPQGRIKVILVNEDLGF